MSTAVFSSYRSRNPSLHFQASPHSDCEQLQPGLVLIGSVVDHAFRERTRVLHFLRGEHEYRTQWSRSMSETRTLTGCRGGPGAAIYRVRKEPMIELRIKRLFPFLRRVRHGPEGGPVGTKDQRDA